jgi:hypothetical protein
MTLHVDRRLRADRPSFPPIASTAPTRGVQLYLEVLVAMAAGMIAAPALEWGIAAVGVSASPLQGADGLVPMTATMTVAMVAWMRLRGSRWAECCWLTALAFGCTMCVALAGELGAIRSARTAALLDNMAIVGTMSLAMLWPPASVHNATAGVSGLARRWRAPNLVPGAPGDANSHRVTDDTHPPIGHPGTPTEMP